MGFVHQLPDHQAFLFAGVPQINRGLYHRVRFMVGDPAGLIVFPQGKRPDPETRSLFILRDIEMDRAKAHARADQVYCPKDFAPSDGLSGDRETATAQAIAECLIRHDVHEVVTDRSLPMIYVDQLQARGIQVRCDLELGVRERRQKDEQEIEWLRHAQKVTEGAMQMACHLVASADVDGEGGLIHDGRALTSARVRQAIDVWLLEQGFHNPGSIVAGGPEGAVCHHIGVGTLRTEQPVIIDIFPRDRETGYNGDCTRTVVHGAVPAEVARMHATVVKAKQAATNACRAGVSGEDVHQASVDTILADGFHVGLPGADAPLSWCSMVHGTGHGIGLEVHEPPLLDFGGPELLVGDALTIEPGLYRRDLGGIRVEDMVIVTADGTLNLNQLPEGLDWS